MEESVVGLNCVLPPFFIFNIIWLFATFIYRNGGKWEIMGRIGRIMQGGVQLVSHVVLCFKVFKYLMFF